MQIPKEHELQKSLRLTRYLYIYDEVVYSLLTELLLRQNVNACYYLISELYYTDTAVVFDLLWKIYFDFYAENHPTFGTCLANKHNAWVDRPNIRPVIFIIKNMFLLRGSSTVFHLRQFVENGGKCLCLYRLQEKTLVKRGWKTYPKLVCRLFIAIGRGHIQNAGCYIYKLLDAFSSEEIYFMLVDYFSEHVALKKIDMIRKRWDRRLWRDDGHMLLAFIVSMSTSLEKIERRLTFKPPSVAELEFVDDVSRVEDVLPYRILREKRRNVLVPEISSFQLSRTQVPNFPSAIRDNWAFYAIRTPIWKQRFARFGGRIEDGGIVFPSEDNEERFYSLYGLEPDEQSLDMQNSGYVGVCGKPVYWRAWHDAVFGASPRIRLNDDYKYNW